MNLKKAMAVYYPEDPLERAIQDASHQYTGEWLPMAACQIMSNALASLRIFRPDWLEGELIRQRCSYLFSPEFTSNKDIMIFLTHPLFLRDILENREINASIHQPIVLVTTPIAHYLFREYPIHMYIHRERLLSDNKDIHLMTMGGMMISEDTVKLEDEAVLRIKTIRDGESEPLAQDVAQQTGFKAAASLVSPGVFQIDEHERSLLPDSIVYDKDKREKGVITIVEPGETGEVHVRYEDDTEMSIGKQFFDTRFVVV